jgi:haloacetate dehalogenase
MYNQTNQELATRYWHWFFLIQPNPFPETILLDSVEMFKEQFFGSNYGVTGKGFFHEEAIEVYVAQLTDSDTVTAMCEDYRAASTIDLDEARKDVEEGRKIKCPVRVLWGKKGVIGKCFDALGEWRAVSDAEVSGEAVDSGHYIAEEVPGEVLRHVREFFG